MKASRPYIMESTMKDVIGKTPYRTILAAIIIFFYVFLHLLTLSRHPFVHSDEAWLAVLTRAMIAERSPAATEEVFRLTPRYPHALKTLYHVLQMPFLAVSWSAFAARLPSLTAGIAALFFLSRIAQECGLRGWRRFVPSALMSVDPQFWYSAHFGRQEMILVALFLWAWSLKARNKSAALTALPPAAGIFIHPNIFIIALAIGALYAADLLGCIGKKNAWKRPLTNLAVFSGILAASAAAALGASVLMDSGFLNHYTDFGDRVGAGDSIAMKILGLPRFLGKMWNRRAGTYYLADVRPMFVLGSLGYLITAVRAIFQKKGRGRLLLIPSLLVGIIIVGKYAPPTVVFLMPSLYLALGEAFFGEWNAKGLYRRYGKRITLAAAAVSWILPAVISFSEVRESLMKPSYTEYVRFLQESVGPLNGDERILVNLNAAFAFGYDTLVIWRDLTPLSGNHANEGRDGETKAAWIGNNTAESLTTGMYGDLETFLDNQCVSWIVLPDELNYIYERRPVWNALYGTPGWYPPLMEILERRGEEISRGFFPNYAMRIVPLMKSNNWSVGVYRLKQ